jgi:hypothetical protein
MQLAASHGVHHLRTRAAMIGKHLRPALRKDLWLVLHVLPAAAEQQKRCQAGNA